MRSLSATPRIPSITPKLATRRLCFTIMRSGWIFRRARQMFKGCRGTILSGRCRWDWRSHICVMVVVMMVMVVVVMVLRMREGSRRRWGTAFATMKWMLQDRWKTHLLNFTKNSVIQAKVPRMTCYSLS